MLSAITVQERQLFLCGLHKEASGQFLWNEKPQDRKERLHRSYMVMQDVNFELFADSVEAECSFGIRNPDKSLIETTMDSLGLLPYRTHHPNTLSGGQKQRVAVAVSMICGKELLVFDEPTSGLDFDSMEQVALLIQKLSAMGKVIFVVTHDYLSAVPVPAFFILTTESSAMIFRWFRIMKKI